MPDDSQNLIDKKRLDDLLVIVEKLAITVEFCNLTDSEFSIRSGRCKVKGQDMILLDKTLPPRHHVGIILDALGAYDLEAVYLPDWVREALERSQTGAAPQ